MKAKQVWTHCRRLAGSTDQIQWEKDLVFKVGGKMYVCSGMETDSRYSFKVDDHRFLELTDLPGIEPAPYLARHHWVQINPAACPLGAAELKELISRSHALVLGKLSKKKQREILGE
ncbi:MAG: MmcQ/YjbR family DNA-binding protein [Pseudomonadota bacterium]